MAWASFPVAIRPAGSSTIGSRPAFAAYAAAEAEVFPVEAQTTACAPAPADTRDRDGHPAILERAGRVGALDLDPDLAAEPVGQHLGLDQRGTALTEGDHRIGVGHRQPLPVAGDHAAGGLAPDRRLQRTASG